MTAKTGLIPQGRSFTAIGSLISQALKSCFFRGFTPGELMRFFCLEIWRITNAAEIFKSPQSINYKHIMLFYRNGS